MGADRGVKGGPGGTQLDLRTVALPRQFAEAGRQDLRRRSRRRDVPGAARVERIDEPRPRDVGEERVEPDVGLERRLREADDAEAAAPCLGFARVVEEDEPAGAELGVVAVAVRA